MKANEKKDNVQATAVGETQKKGKINWEAWLKIALLAILAYYPLRHVYTGGDLWDVGYNYGNFTYFGMDRIGKTWFFSTYLANAVGHLLTFLPYGNTVLGLNAYTALFSSALAVMGFLFCTRTLKFSPIITFFGEILALSMCWCPTALLYNYLTYVLFFSCVILLYLGLSRKKTWMLLLAGACLGINVFVRFSNLPEMGLIASVWAYSAWDAWEGRSGARKVKDGGIREDGKAKEEPEREAAGKAKEEPAKEELEKEAGQEQGSWIGEAFRKMGLNTLWCFLGYLAALVLCLGWIALRYGISDYVSGIKALFAMTDVATDYQPSSMIYVMLWQYKEALHWVIRLGFFAALASVIVLITDHVPACLEEKKRDKVRKLFTALGALGVAAVTVFMAYWMFYQRKDQPNLTTFCTPATIRSTGPGRCF